MPPLEGCCDSKNRRGMRTVCLFVLLCVSALSYGAKKYKLVEISTNLGNIKIRLYENTPRHSENFLKLVKAHHYDSLLFHRVIGDFMIQGGSSDSRHAPKETAVGMSNPGIYHRGRDSSGVSSFQRCFGCCTSGR